MDYIVRKRYGGEPALLTSFVRPDDYLVRKIAEGLPLSIGACWNWVCINIEYPSGRFPDRHVLHAFTRRGILGERAFLTYVDLDLWHYPGEVIFMSAGNCDDSAILLTSMLRRFIDSKRVYVSIGTFQNLGHAWCSIFIDGKPYVLETTLSRAKESITYMPEELPYDVSLRFNDIAVVEVKPIPPWVLLQYRPRLNAIEVLTKSLSIEQNIAKASLLASKWA